MINCNNFICLNNIWMRYLSDYVQFPGKKLFEKVFWGCLLINDWKIKLFLVEKIRKFLPKMANFLKNGNFENVNFCCTFNSYVFACAFPRFLPSTMLHLAVCPFAKLCPKREAVLGQYCIFIRRSSRHPARPIPKQLTFGRFQNIIFRFRILEKKILKIQIFEKNERQDFRT